MIGRLAPRWHFLDDGAADGVTNMARDLQLLDAAARTGEATLRVYTWSRPTLSFGRNERTRGRFAPERLSSSGIDVVRRPTGGRALLHHREVTYSVTAPAGTLPLGESYRAINTLLLDALTRLGVSARTAEVGPPIRPEGAACFAAPSAGELVVDGAKLVGSAQLREGSALLQHGSILLEDDQSMIDSLREPRAPSGALAAVATLRSLLGREITPKEVAASLAAALGARVTSPEVSESPLGATAPSSALLERFTDPAWTWRR